MRRLHKLCLSSSSCSPHNALRCNASHSLPVMSGAIRLHASQQQQQQQRAWYCTTKHHHHHEDHHDILLVSNDKSSTASSAQNESATATSTTKKTHHHQQQQHAKAKHPDVPVQITLTHRKMAIRALTDAELRDIDRVKNQLNQYFEHISFRKGWKEPHHKKEDVQKAFHEAATLVVNIRKYLDCKNPGQKLRMVDGNAQMFLHTDESVALRKKGQRGFTDALVHNVMQDARGYVEGLNKKTVDDYLFDLYQFRFNRKARVEHRLAELAELVNQVKLRDLDIGDKQVIENGDLDGKWDKAIDSVEDAVAAMRHVAKAYNVDE